MPKGYLSNRQQNLKIGITSYTENSTVLDVTGNSNFSGIGTFQSDLYVGGDVNITGVVTALSVSSPFIMSYNQIVESFTIPPNHNSVSIGPILSINSGAIITVSINSNWTIIP